MPYEANESGGIPIESRPRELALADLKLIEASFSSIFSKDERFDQLRAANLLESAEFTRAPSLLSRTETLALRMQNIDSVGLYNDLSAVIIFGYSVGKVLFPEIKGLDLINALADTASEASNLELSHEERIRDFHITKQAGNRGLNLLDISARNYICRELLVLKEWGDAKERSFTELAIGIGIDICHKADENRLLKLDLEKFKRSGRVLFGAPDDVFEQALKQMIEDSK